MAFLQRKVYRQLKDHLSKPEISLIIGPRQAGKTTIMLRLEDELKKKNRPAAYFNLDVIEDAQFFKSQHNLLAEVKKRAGKERGVVFIDEIHRLANAGLFLKGLYDLRTGHKIIASGSGSLELKADIIEPMTGRKKVFTLLPLDFSEFAANMLNVGFEQVTNALSRNPYERQRLVNDYLTYGGYPRVILAEEHKEKMEILSEIYRSYLEKDIQLLLGVEKNEAFQALVKILASQVGNLVNRAELANTVGVNQKTIKKYLYLLEKTYIISLVRPFFQNVRKEIKKTPKIYFTDLGFLQLGRGSLVGAQMQLYGSFLENACFLRLKEVDLFEPIRFWRSVAGAEVDFIVSSSQKGIIPVEVKTKMGKKETLGRSLISFIRNYQPQKVYLYTENESSKLHRYNTEIEILPYWRLPEF